MRTSRQLAQHARRVSSVDGLTEDGVFDDDSGICAESETPWMTCRSSHGFLDRETTNVVVRRLASGARFIEID